MTCTHATCQTPFCPHCGEGIIDSTGGAILSMFRANLERSKGELERRVYRKDKEDDQHSAWHTKKVIAGEALVVKWTAWESWVAAHIAKDAEGLGEGTEKDYRDLLDDLNTTIERCGLVQEGSYGKVIQQLVNQIADIDRPCQYCGDEGVKDAEGEA